MCFLQFFSMVSFFSVLFACVCVERRHICVLARPIDFSDPVRTLLSVVVFLLRIRSPEQSKIQIIARVPSLF